jgi:tRNA pseudouridine38-40 synthase
LFFNQIDQFKENHFLWLSAGGMKVAQINNGSAEGRTQEDVDKQLGDEDENPEGGDG